MSMTALTLYHHLCVSVFWSGTLALQATNRNHIKCRNGGAAILGRPDSLAEYNELQSATVHCTTNHESRSASLSQYQTESNVTMGSSKATTFQKRLPYRCWSIAVCKASIMRVKLHHPRRKACRLIEGRFSSGRRTLVVAGEVTTMRNLSQQSTDLPSPKFPSRQSQITTSANRRGEI
jgi:hypothetical protein